MLDFSIYQWYIIQAASNGQAFLCNAIIAKREEGTVMIFNFRL
jgi:hypothetical protein